MKKRKLVISLIVAGALLQSCGGGGGGDGSDGGSGGGSSNDTGTTWRASAPVTQNGCGDRIAGVNQPFTLEEDVSGLVVDTSLVNMPAQDDGTNITFNFADENSGCSRSYAGTITRTSETAATIALSVITNCGSGSCENKWAGTATKE